MGLLVFRELLGLLKVRIVRKVLYNSFFNIVGSNSGMNEYNFVGLLD